MPVNNNLKINFNTPVIFDKEVLKNKKPIEKALISIGQVADEYLHMGNKYLKVNATKIESVSIKSPVLKSVFKVFSYILSFGLLPAIASIAKAVYKNWAQKQPLPEQKSPTEKEEQEIPKATDPSPQTQNSSTNKQDPIKKEDSTKSETEQPESTHAEVEDVDTETSPEAKAFYKQTKNGRIAARGGKTSLGHVKWQKSTSQNLSKTHSSNDLQKQIDELLNELQSENNASDDTTIVKKLLQIRRLMPKNSSTDYALNTVNANLLKSIAMPPPVENKEEIYNKDGQVAIQARITGGIPAKWLGLDELTYKCISYILMKNQKDRKFLPQFNNDEKKALLDITTRKKEEEEKLQKKGQRPTPIVRTDSKKFVILNLNQFRSTNTSSSLSTVDEDSEGSGTFKFKGRIDSSMTSDEESEETGTVKYNEQTVASQNAKNNLSSEEDSSDEDSFIINEGVEDRPFNHQFDKDSNSSSEDSDDTFIEKP